MSNRETPPIDLSDLVNLLNQWEKIQDISQEITGTKAQFVDKDGRFITSSEHLPKVCRLIQSSKIGQRRCHQSYKMNCFSSETIKEGFSIFKCHAGLLNFALPLVLQGEVIGAISIGGVLEDEAVYGRYRRFSQEVGISEDDLLMNLQLIRKVSKDQLFIGGKMLRPLIQPFLETIFRYYHLQESADRFIKLIEEKDGLLMIDDLTSLHNRRYLFARLDGEIARAERYNLTLSLILIDIDRLEEINQTYGHPIGDQVLKEFTSLLLENIRKSEILTRAGGKKFMIILPNTGEERAYEVAERLRNVIKGWVFLKDRGLNISLTSTFGVASFSKDIKTPEDLIKRAEEALFCAKKEGGKDRVRTFTYVKREKEGIKRRVVITGLGVITSLGIGKEAFWEAVCQGKSGISRIEGFNTSNLKVKIGGEIRDTQFDPLNWMDKKRIKRTGRETQFAIVATQMALKDANLDIRKLDPQRIGVIIGAGVGGLGFGEEQYKTYLEKGPNKVSPYLPMVIFAGAVSSEVSIDLNAKGPSFTVSTGCSAGSDAIGYSFNKIRNGEVDLIVTGGTESPIKPIIIAAFQEMRALSTRNNEPERASRPFDRERDGFVLSEGAGILILEELEHAIRRGARIYAEVVGYGATVDAHHMTAPDPEGKENARAIRLALRDANIKPEEVDYINAHGSSTPLGDKVETQVFKRVFGDYAYKLPISSTKSMLGHSIGATGAIELIVCTLGIQNGFIPPTINYEVKDPECDLDYVPNIGRRAMIDIALSNSIGFGGKNSVVVLRRYRE